MTDTNAVQDGEVAAMGSLLSVLTPLDEPTRSRVLQWALARFGVAAGSRGSPGTQAYGTLVDEENELPQSEEDFAEMADLFIASGAKTGPEKVLVAGYWHQIRQGKPDFGSFEVNKELNDLGHRVNSINKVFDALMEQKPQLVVQVKKSAGGRRRHKLTAAGLTRVKEMLSRTQPAET